MRSTVVRLGAVIALSLLVGVACRQEVPEKRARSLAVYPTNIPNEPRIRILVADKLGQATLTVSGAYALEVVDPDGSTRSGGGEHAVAVQVVPTGQGLQVGKSLVLKATIRPTPGRLVGLRYVDADGRQQNYEYSNELTLMPCMRTVQGQSRPAVRAVVSPGLEEYLVGVVSHEMYPIWPLEALRAQAVASRTFALYQSRMHAERDWDVRASVSDQVWRPVRRANPRVLMAVNSTRGIVMLDDNRLFKAFFHRQCGGYTANAKDVLLKKEIKALWRVRCPFCEKSPAELTLWRFPISKQELSSRLGRRVPAPVKHITLLDREGRPLRGMDRVHTVELTLTTGTKVAMPANAGFRTAVGSGAKALASTWFAVHESPDQTHFIFEGRGAGHGVGMCQYGAKYMAKVEHASFQDILARFYTGTRLVRLWGE